MLVKIRENKSTAYRGCISNTFDKLKSHKEQTETKSVYLFYECFGSTDGAHYSAILRKNKREQFLIIMTMLLFVAQLAI